ncbi:MAG: RluA family pseudouridine synthase [Candidatus Cryosericum sp.]|nr:RluA family pseudouridine synthase [Candidatus Cryosericum sp.]HPS69592.1 RluA family pseudouridine synthase [Candidatus Cryosericum sp.]
MRELEADGFVVPVLYLDDDTIVVNKPSGLAVMTKPGQVSGTLSGVVLAAGVTLYAGTEAEVPGVVHRLDKDTSGVMVLARSARAWLSLHGQIAEHSANKEYVALVSGTFTEKRGRIDVPIGAMRSHGLLLRQADSSGRPSTTTFEVIRSFAARASLLRVSIQTGRTHQIRVHCSYIGHPVLGDYTYGYRTQSGIDVKRQMLHSFSLAFVSPATGTQVRAFAALPADFKSVLGGLARNYGQ